MAESWCIILTGAPKAQDLAWDSINLTHALQTPVKRFLGDNQSTARPGLTQPSTTLPKWRTIPMHRDEGGSNRLVQEESPQTHFLPFDHNMERNDDEDRLQFLNDSLLQLNELESSAIADLGETSLYPSTFSLANTTCTTSFGSTANGYFSSIGMPDPQNPSAATGLNIHGDITDLKRIPSASDLARMHPQTLTISTLAAIISISAPRTVRLRRQSGKEMDIIELLLGDETRAGFSVSFWLAPADSQHKPADDLRDQLLSLRVGDVVLLRNVALRAWNGCVYGQSLSRRFAKNSTDVVVVGGDSGIRVEKVFESKMGRVQRWSWEFVGRREGPLGTAGAVEEGEEVLPPDTQSPVKT